MSTICLNMIVKNEEHVIEQTLKNIIDKINLHYWVICDTGSTDKTREIIKNFFQDKKIEGELLDHKWVDFGHNRTLALEAAYKKADYIFIFDADDSIHGTPIIPVLSHDMYKMKFGSSFTYYRPLLVTAQKKSKFVGVLHEYLTLETGPSSEGEIQGEYYVDSGKTGFRSKDPDKYLKDALILKEAYHKELNNNIGLASRYAFYCAQSFKDAEKPKEAIEWYTLVIDKLHNWTQEKYFSCIMVGQLYNNDNSFQKAIEYFLKADMFDSERIEGVVFAVEMLKKANIESLIILLYEKYKNYIKKPENKLFLFEDSYQDILEFNASISALKCNNKSLAYLCIKKILLNNIAQNNIIDVSFNNLRITINEMKEDPDTINLFYRVTDFIQTNKKKEGMTELWNILFDKNRSKLCAKVLKPSICVDKSSKKVFLSITSCKRLNLFTETVNSILNHWTDYQKIDYWFCVDDNSSFEDRKSMRRAYPFINFYMKTPSEKGHRISMNIIWNKLVEMKPTYWIHLEDDFLFFIKSSYVTKSINFLESNSDTKIKQILFNRAYSETIEDIDIQGYLPLSKGFVLHEHKEGLFPYKNCHYWPHYSFRPSMIDVNTILSLGNYDSENTFFERDYANKWEKAGYKSAFFDLISCRHTGRLTSQISDNTIKNAYELNNENQFITTEKTHTNHIVKILHEEHETKRKENMIALFKSINFKYYEFISSVDINKKVKKNELKTLFEGNNFEDSSNIIRNALNHYNIWNNLLEDTMCSYYIIFEDNITVSSYFTSVFEKIKADKYLEQIDFLFFGYNMTDVNREKNKDKYENISTLFTIADLETTLYNNGCFGYSINKNGARLLIEYIKKNGIKQPIHQLILQCNDLKRAELRPQIVFSSSVQTHNTKEKIDFSNIDFEYFTFIKGVDHIGDDLFFNNVSIEEAKRIAFITPECVGFNTLGFFKSTINISNLEPSPYFKETDGIYVKNHILSKTV